jgi:hypothetical protein
MSTKEQNQEIDILAEDLYEITQGLDREAITRKIVGKSKDELFQLIGRASFFDSEVKFRNILKKSKFDKNDIIAALFDITNDVELFVNAVQNKVTKISGDEEDSGSKSVTDLSLDDVFKDDKKELISKKSNQKPKYKKAMTAAWIKAKEYHGQFKSNTQKQPEEKKWVSSSVFNAADTQTNKQAGVFGNYAWSSRSWVSNYAKQKPPYEPDTTEEEKAFYDLQSHFSDNENITPKTATILSDILKSGKYSDVIKPYKGVLYRGMKDIPIDFIMSILKLPKETISDLLSKSDYIHKQSFKFKPKKEISSWSEDPSAIQKFADGYSYKSYMTNELRFSIVLKANSNANNNNLIRCVDGLYKIHAFSEFQIEKEVIAIGEVVVDSIEIKKLSK